MTRLNTNIQVSAGLDTSQYVAGAKVVADTNQEIVNSTKGATAAIVKDAEAAAKKTASSFAALGKNASDSLTKDVEDAAEKTTFSFAALGKNASDSFLGALTGGLLGAGIAGAIAGIASVIGTSLVTAISELKELGDTADALGLSAEGLYTFQAALKAIGGTATGAVSALETLQTNIRRDAAVLKDFGIASKDAAGNFRDIEDVLNEVSDLLALYEGTTQGAIIAQKLFGSEWVQVVELIKNGSTALAESRKEQEGNADAMAQMSRYLDIAGEAASGAAIDVGEFTAEVALAAAAAVKYSPVLASFDTLMSLIGTSADDATASLEALEKTQDKITAAGKVIDANRAKVLAENKKAEEERAKQREKDAKEAIAAAKALAAEQKRAAAEAERQAEAYAKLRASGVDAIGDVTKELKEQSQAYADLVTYGADYADIMASVRGAESERLDTLDKLNELLAKGAISQKEYNQAVEDGKTIRDSKVASSTTDALNAALQPLKEIQSITAGLDFAKGLFGDDALKALESYQLSVENSALALSIVNAELAAGVITEAEYADALKETTDQLNTQTAANKERIDALQKDAQAQAQFVGDVKGAFDEFFDSLIDGSESGADAVKKLVAELLRAVAIAKLLELAGIGGGISIGGNSATPKAAIGSSAGLFSTRASGSPITIINNTGAPLQAQRNGDNSYKLTLGVVAAAIAQGNNPVARGIESQYGLRRTYGAY